MDKRPMDRYSRQVLIEQIGPKGQAILGSSKVLVLGCGALGTVTADLLARSGIGSLVLVDRDIIELSNLQRQTLYDENDIDTPKATTAAKRLHQINSDIEIQPLVEDIYAANIERHVGGVDMVIDGTDNMETRFLINDVCAKHKIPWVYGGAVSSNGMTMTIVPGSTPCLSCLIPTIPAPGALPTCENVGVLNTLTAMIAAVQATEVIKVLLGKGPRPGLMTVDIWSGDIRIVNLRKRPDCPVCSGGKLQYLEAEPDSKGSAYSLCGSNSVQIRPARGPDPKVSELDLQALAKRLEPSGEVDLTPLYVRIKMMDDLNITVFKDGRAIIKGTSDIEVARGIYAKYIGT